MPLPTSPYQTVIEELEKKFKEVKFSRFQSDLSNDANDLEETIQTVELRGLQSIVDQALIEIADRVKDLHVETLTCDDIKIETKIEEDYKRSIQKQFTVSITFRRSQNICVITGEKTCVKKAKEELKKYINALKACAQNEELVPLPGAPNKTLAKILNQKSYKIQKLEITYQITDINIDQNRIRFLTNSTKRQAAVDAIQEFIIENVKESQTVHKLKDETKVLFAKKFIDKLTLISNGTKLEFLNEEQGGRQNFGFPNRNFYLDHDNRPANYSWAYQVRESDNNYKLRQDESLDWFFYDWDQNEQIEAFYQSVRSDPNLWMYGCIMQDQVIGDMIQQKNGFTYQIKCLSDDQANSSSLDVDSESTRFRQKNITVETERRIARFDRTCHSKKPKQSSLVAVNQSMQDQVDRKKYSWVLKLTGFKDSVDNVINELNSLYADKNNHKTIMTLCRNPNPKEFRMIQAYLKKKFKAEVKLVNNQNAAQIEIIGMNQGPIQEWVAKELYEFLQKDFPDEWEDSLEQFCAKTNLKTHFVQKDSSLWNQIIQQFNQKRPKPNAMILSIQVIQNLQLWSIYQQEIKNLKYRDKQWPLVLRLWHGTSETKPAQLFNNDGLNIAYSAPSGLWGSGIYFAVNANYSCPKYSYQVPEQQNVYEVFCANVVIGNFYNSGPIHMQGTKEPPQIQGKNRSFDSIKGFTNDSDVFIVYKNQKTYPGILVRYQI